MDIFRSEVTLPAHLIALKWQYKYINALEQMVEVCISYDYNFHALSISCVCVCVCVCVCARVCGIH